MRVLLWGTFGAVRVSRGGNVRASKFPFPYCVGRARELYVSAAIDAKKKEESGFRECMCLCFARFNANIYCV